MKALTIWQPWASLIARGVKQYETRSWPTKYRGPIAIHAAMKNPLSVSLSGDCMGVLIDEMLETRRLPLWEQMPRGAVIATAELVNVWHIVYHPGPNVDKARHIDIGAESMTEDKHDPHFGDYFVPTDKEIILGDWTPGRYAWELANVKPLPRPIPVKGKQGLWTFEMKEEDAQKGGGQV